MVRFYQLNPPATEADIEAFEQLVGPLPGDYLDWMRQHDGGELPTPGLLYEVRRAHQLDEAPRVSTINPLQRARRTAEGEGWGPGGSLTVERPGGFVGFADNGGHLYYLIDLRPVTFGSIWVWDQDRAAMPELGQDPLTWWDNMTLVANSFTDFLNRLVLTRWDPDTLTFVVALEEAE